jgi:hypothetical protein
MVEASMEMRGRLKLWLICVKQNVNPVCSINRASDGKTLRYYYICDKTVRFPPEITDHTENEPQRCPLSKCER